MVKQLAKGKQRLTDAYWSAVGMVSVAKETLEYLRSRGMTKVMTCFDMDYLKNPHVKDGYFNLATMLSELEIEYGTYLWDPNFKGLDDYVWHCRKQGTI